MAVVTVKNKYQVVIPSEVRERINISIGDILKASVQGGTITLTPQTLVDREIAEGLEDIKRGRVTGPFHSAKDLIASLHSNATKKSKKSSSRR
ncbi:MAG: AbrB/MazE/SpoVT family DNA-binding domain-containing protein [Candidatus Uhrbacteria bacterium]|nr:AbrB/MazE/SpoVT family DNA-binding domain-containing protein [Candidatus Uhrbacteria bacterium]